MGLGLAMSALALLAPPLESQTPKFHGKRPKTFEVRNVHVLRGDGSPPEGPRSLFVRDGRIEADRIDKPDVVIDGTGHYVLPGLVNTHAHLHEAMAKVPMPKEYQLNLWLASGITAMRDNGSNFRRTHRLRAQQKEGELAAPRILIYRMFGAVATAEEARQRVRSFKNQGADGIKLWSNLSYPPEVLAAILDEAGRKKLPCTAHIGVGESNARHYAELGVRSIEHWYGIPDAAIAGGGVQDFPADFSYSNEVHRFRYAGRLWREADPDRLDDVLVTMVDEDVAWSPTLAVYEASRDLMRAQHKPWFDGYLHPALERFFRPSLESHGSYFIGWTSTDEAFWRENYQIWFGALRRFAALGGTITTGEDAGYIYLLYGFGLVRELELQHEAGFHPLEVLRHATYNGAKVLGMEDQFGRILPGLAADLAIVHGNPLANFKVFYPTGCDFYEDGKSVRGGGVQYTIVDGRIYHGPTLREEVRDLVTAARAKIEAKAEAAGGAR